MLSHVHFAILYSYMLNNNNNNICIEYKPCFRCAKCGELTAQFVNDTPLTQAEQAR